jgi:hypothetical protein
VLTLKLELLEAWWSEKVLPMVSLLAILMQPESALELGMKWVLQMKLALAFLERL